MVSPNAFKNAFGLMGRGYFVGREFDGLFLT